MPSQTKIAAVNTKLMTHNKVIVYGFSFSLFSGISEEVLHEKFHERRRLTKAQEDFLDNNGNLLKDEERNMFLTGCESSKKIIEALFGIKPKLVSHYLQ